MRLGRGRQRSVPGRREQLLPPRVLRLPPGTPANDNTARERIGRELAAPQLAGRFVTPAWICHREVLRAPGQDPASHARSAGVRLFVLIVDLTDEGVPIRRYANAEERHDDGTFKAFAALPCPAPTMTRSIARWRRQACTCGSLDPALRSGRA
jgi:hypothetical protein